MKNATIGKKPGDLRRFLNRATDRGCFHTDYKAMKPYIDIVDSIKTNSMAKFDGLL